MSSDGRGNQRRIEDAAIGGGNCFEDFAFGETNFHCEGVDVMRIGEILQRSRRDGALVKKGGCG